METLINIVFGILVIIGISVVMCFPFMWLWNWLMPEIFGLIRIDVWQSMGLVMLSNSLFKGTSKD